MMPLSETGLFGQAAILLVAPVIGFAFGWFLERGGLADARKLAGQFYLTDLTVFKVLFTAVITAMLGGFWLDRLGVLDLDLVYLPETFVLPQAVGGVLFGAGFLLGGLCPGTSCVAAASGRLDGIAVIAGMLLGVLGFNVAYEWVAPLYNSTPLGSVTFTELMGVSRGVGVALVSLVALAGFIGARTIDRIASTTTHRAIGIAAAALALGALAVDASPAPRFISAPALAEWIMRRDDRLRVFDLRSRDEFQQFHVAGARHATLGSLRREPLPEQATTVVYANSAERAARAWALLAPRSADAFVLREGLYEWIARVHEPRLSIDATADEKAAFEQAARYSRFFGGRAQEGVARSELFSGYWTGAPADSKARLDATLLAAATIRRRGC